MPTNPRFNGKNHSQLPDLISDTMYLKDLPQTSDAPTGYGNVAAVVNGLVGVYRNTGCVKVGGAIATSGNKNRTFQCTFMLRRKPARVRVHILNANATAITGVAAALAPSANQATWYEPSGGASAFKSLTFSTTTIAAGKVYTGGQNVVTSEIVSNWINPSAIERNDGGSGYIFMLRVYSDSVENGSRMYLGQGGPTSDFQKYEARCGYAQNVGNLTTTSSVFIEDSVSCPAFFLDVEYEEPVASIAIVGDSIMQGANADPGVGSAAYGAAFQALKSLAAEGKSVQLFNAGWAGASTSNGSSGGFPDVIGGYLGQFMEWVNSGAKPTIAAFCPWSVNNSSAYQPAQLNSVKLAIGVFISLCEQYRIIPALVTPAPRNGITQAEETARRAVVQYIKDYCASYNIILIDRDAIYTDYSSATGGYKLPEWCIDNIHPNQLGHEVESLEWVSVLKNIL